MIDPQLIDFLLDRQGQKIAVRIDPNSSVWNDQPTGNLWPSKEWLIDAYQNSMNSYTPNVEVPDKFSLPVPAKWRHAFFIEGGYLLVSNAKEWFIDGHDPEYDDPFGDPESSSYDGPNQVKVWYPAWLGDGEDYGWELSEELFMGQGYYNLDWYMIEQLHFHLWHCLQNGVTKLFKFSESKGQYLQLKSKNRIDLFLELINSGALKGKSFFWRGYEFLEEKPSSDIVLDFNKTYKAYGEDLVNSITNIPGLMSAFGWYMRIPHTDMWYSFKTLAHHFPYLASGPMSTVSKAVDKFAKQGWYVYDIPDIQHRDEPDTFLEAFDSFIEELMGAG